MGYTKVRVHYKEAIRTIDPERKMTITLTKKVIEAGEKNGFSSLTVTTETDSWWYGPAKHIAIKSGSTVLLKREVPNFIERVLSYEWL
jgi:hypothetical protein